MMEAVLVVLTNRETDTVVTIKLMARSFIHKFY